MPILSALGLVSRFGKVSSETGIADPSYDLISSAVSQTTSISFSSIPQTYKHLQIKGSIKSLGGGSGSVNMLLRFNADTGQSYRTMQYSADGNSFNGASSQSTGSSIIVSRTKGEEADQPPVPFILDIFDYSSTSRKKAVKGFYGSVYLNTGTVNYITFPIGFWNNTSAITSISLFAADSRSLTPISVQLYGIKG